MMKMLLHNYKAWWRIITIMTSLWILVQSEEISEKDPFCNRVGDLKEVGGKFQCTCYVDYSGTKCETYIPCISSPCVNGWCGDDGDGGWICKCKSGYTGITCNEDIDECASQPCQHGNCTNSVARYDCTCDELYQGPQCDIYALCDPSPCDKGSCLKNGTDGFKCICQRGSTGTLCDEDINECESAPCVHGKCSNRRAEYRCYCDDGYGGTNCETDINECESAPCVHGKCHNRRAKYECECDDGYEGINCATDINECESSPCVHGKCSNRRAKYECECDGGYNGINCETVITEPTTTTEDSSTTTTAEASTAEPQPEEDSMDKAQVLGIGIASGLAISGIAVAAVKGFTFIKWKTGSGLSSMGTNQVNDMRYRLPKGSRNKPMRNGEGRNESKKDGDNISMRSLASKGSTVSLMGRYGDFITAEVTFWDDMHVRRHSEALKDVQPAERPWCPVIETLI